MRIAFIALSCELAKSLFHTQVTISKLSNKVPLLGCLQHVDGAFDLLEVRTFMASQPICID